MICCLNPDCDRPLNPVNALYCKHCGTPITLLKGRYRPLKPLGAGGFGKTYLAQDVDKLDEYCVIKQFAPMVFGHKAVAKAKELFEREARGLQSLGVHPQIPSLYAYFEYDNRLYLVQEYIEGRTLLQELAEDGIFSEAKVKQVLIELLEILQFVHQQGVIHRDIKPQNIIRRQSDQKIVLIDFGISKQLTHTSLARPGTTIGSFGYVPKEQMQAGVATAACDLYSVGATCFHLVSGIHPRQPWNRNGYGWVKYWRNYLIHPVEPKLDVIIDRLLQEDPKIRYQTVKEVIKDFYATSAPVLNRRPIVPIKTKIPTASGDSAFYDAATILPSAPASNRKKWQWSRASKLGIFVLVTVALASWGAVQLYSYLSNRTFFNPLISLFSRSTTDRFLLQTLQDHTEWVNAVAITADGNFMVSGSADQTIKIWDYHNPTVVSTLTGHERGVEAIATTRLNGTNLIASGGIDQTVKLWRLDLGALLVTLQGHTDWVNALAISPDGSTLVSGSADNTIKIWRLADQELVHTLTEKNQILSLAISPDGNTLASGGEDNAVSLWDLHTGELLKRLEGHQTYIHALAFTPDSNTLVSGSGDLTIKVWNVSTGEIQSSLISHNGSILALDISPDGEHLISGSADNSIKIWHLPTGKLRYTFADGNAAHESQVNAIAIHPSGKSFVSGSSDRTIKIWRLP